MKIQYGDKNKMSIPRRALGAEAEFTSAKAVNRGTKCSSDENIIGGGVEYYHFHILTSSLSEDTTQQFQKLQNTLSEKYPCKIELHIVENDEFENLPKWGFEETKVDTTYYRIKLSQFLPKDVGKCLYLDTDMLVLTDLREIFAYDMGDYVIASSMGTPSKVQMKKQAVYREKLDTGKKEIAFETSFYFCGGFMLVNVKEWIKQDIESKAMYFLTQYHTEFADQDALNFALCDKKVLDLGSRWGLLMYQYIFSLCDNETSQDEIKQYNEALLHSKVLHCNGPAKAWFGVSKIVNSFMPNHYPYKHIWYEMAKKCNAFMDELEKNIKEIEQDDLAHYTFLSARLIRQERKDLHRIRKWIRRLDRLKNPKKLLGRIFPKN